MTLATEAEAKLVELSHTAASAPVVRRLRRMLDEGSDLECYKVNAFRLADELAVPRSEAVRALLFATKLGLFDLNYDVFCPSCSGIPDYPRALMGIKNRSHCALCEIDIEVDFEEQLEVTFTANPAARKIEFTDFADRVEFMDRLRFIQTMNQREGRAPAMSALFKPGEKRTDRAIFAAGSYTFRLPRHLDRGGKMIVAGEKTNDVQSLHFVVDEHGDVTLANASDKKCATIRPGPCDVTVEFGYPHLWGFAVIADGLRKNFVSAAYLTSQQDFRDLFSGEFLAPDVSFAIKSTTLMFTDIKGSTEMYETLGDARAFRRVRDHFGLMMDIIRRNEGGVVKTIGDAVMAAFPANVSAVRAACEIQLAFNVVAEPLKGVEVKIGIHRGPAIAVTTNRNLDFFGRTVNIAARVQGKSSPRLVLVSAPVAKDESVIAYLNSETMEAKPIEAELKGIAGAHTLYEIEPKRLERPSTTRLP